tara:strand:- start:698 stop:1420 length:723 start_codon:yes stop_codon:yes gene_type:complete
MAKTPRRNKNKRGFSPRSKGVPTTHESVNEERIIHHHWMVKKQWENGGILAKVRNLIDSNNIMTYADLGASSGPVAEIIIDEFKPQKVWLFEPFSTAFKMLEKNMSKYDCQVNLFNQGIYYGAKKLESFSMSDLNPGGLFLDEVRKKYRPNAKGEKILFDLTTLEAQIDEDIDLMKIDIEGSEWNVIQNSTIIKNRTKFILLERHWKTHEECIEFLEEHLPEFTAIYDDTGEYLLKRKVI